MKAAFDTYAFSYDDSFTHSILGKAQRNRVWELLETDGLLKNKLRILEVNCGTGEDASRFGKLGHSVVATDISKNMVAVAKQKAEYQGLKNVECLQVGLAQMDSLNDYGPFDLVFSNFGGLNCLSPSDLKKCMEGIRQVLVPGGSFVGVVMASFCIWETVYYIVKKPSIAFRRFQKKSTANVGEGAFDVYYFSPFFFHSLPGYKRKTLAPIGFFLPPSYVEGYFSSKPHVVQSLEKWERNLPSNFLFSACSDHYYIHLKRME